MPPRVAFITIGQSPRSDVLPDILSEIRTSLQVTECGALDGLNDAAIADLAPRSGEARLVSRLHDGRRCCSANRRSIGDCTKFSVNWTPAASTCLCCCAPASLRASHCARRSSSRSTLSITSCRVFPSA